MLEAMRLITENAATPTHPDGCIAVTGWDTRPDGIAWVYRTNLCQHDHPDTNAELTEQYAAEGWTNIDA